MTRSTNMEHVEVLRAMLDDAAIEPPWKPEEVAAITAAIASLSAQQPTAVDGADAKDAEIEALRAEVAEARGLVTEANNSLYGSQSYFHSLDGGPYNRHHLANGIEDLKRRSREGYAAEARAERLAEALRWYAEQAALCRKLGADGDRGRQALDADGGKRAYAALRDHDQEGGNP